MRQFEVYFDTRLDIEAFSNQLRNWLNLPGTNSTPHQRAQRREGANFGGIYYLFEVLGLELLLLTNLEEVAVPERYDYSLYLVVQGGDESTNQAVANHICQMVKARGIRSCVDSLSA